MKTVLITGGNRGIGFETASQLARRGFNVIIGSRLKDQAEKAVREIEQGGKASSIDVSDSKSIAAAPPRTFPLSANSTCLSITPGFIG